MATMTERQRCMRRELAGRHYRDAESAAAALGRASRKCSHEAHGVHGRRRTHRRRG